MKRILTATFCLLLAGAGAAQAATAWGLRGGVTFQPDQVHLGAHVNGGELFTDGWFIPNIEIGFGDDLTLVAINPELVYKFAERSRSNWGFYVGGGLGINWYNHVRAGTHGSDSDTQLGLNVLGGMSRNLSTGNEFFVELKLGTSDSPDAKITAGLTFY